MVCGALFALLCLGNIWQDALHPDTFQAPTKPIFVSLGGHCEPAIHIRNRDLRITALPFDWLITNHEGLIAALDEDFRYFLDEQYLFYDPEKIFMLENSRYQIEFRHDWTYSDNVSTPERYATQLLDMKNKYGRRIERFRELKEFKGRVVFMRAAQYMAGGGPNYWWREEEEKITVEQAIEIREAIRRYFPKLDFSLAIINHRFPIDPLKENREQIYFFPQERDETAYDELFSTFLDGD